MPEYNRTKNGTIFGSPKAKTKVINIKTGEETILNSRTEASNFTGLNVKHVLQYIKQGSTYRDTYKFYSID